MARKYCFSVLLFTLCSFLVNYVNCDSTSPFKRFEYKFSFKGPYLAQKDGQVPFWEHGGHSIASEDNVRLAPSLVNREGYIWSKKRANFDGFEVEFAFRILGRGKIGADGLAMWFVEDKQEKSGPVFGGPDKWNGLGLLFDTYDNDQHENNPIVMAVINDKTKLYDHASDGENQDVGHCIRDFRNRPYPVKVRVKYYKGSLSVEINNGISDKEADYEICIPSTKVILPKEGYFGVTAATGGLADDHDIMSFLTHSLTDKAAKGTKEEPTDDERKKFEKEFDEYTKKLQQAQEDYKKEHKDDKQKKKPYVNKGEESLEEAHLRQIWQKQSDIHRTLTEAMTKLVSIETSQNVLLNKAAMAPPGGTGNPNDISTLTYEIQKIKKSLEEIKTHSTGNKGNFLEMQQLSHELRDGMNGIRDDVKQVNIKSEQLLIQKRSDQSEYCSSCLSSTLFLGAITIQSLLFVGYLAYKQSKESAAKKFY